jgi:hypothetical protein
LIEAVAVQETPDLDGSEVAELEKMVSFIFFFFFFFGLFYCLF